MLKTIIPFFILFATICIFSIAIIDLSHSVKTLEAKNSRLEELMQLQIRLDSSRDIEDKYMANFHDQQMVINDLTIKDLTKLSDFIFKR